MLSYARSALFLFLLLSFPLQSQAYASLLDALRETKLSVRVVPIEIGVIPRGAQRVRFLSLTLETTCDGDVRIGEIRIHRFGLGDAADLKGVYILEGDKRITKSSLPSAEDQMVTLRTKGLTMRACEKETIDVAADFEREASVGSEHRFEVLSAEDIVTDADAVKGTFPLRNVGRAASVTPLPTGGITVTFLPISGSISPGANRTLAKFEVSADNESHHLLYAIMLTNEGTAKNADLRSLFLTRSSGKALTRQALTLDGKAVMLTFSKPYFLKRGDKVTFGLIGRPFTSSETIRFVLKEPSDLNAIPTRQGGRRLGE